MTSVARDRSQGQFTNDVNTNVFLISLKVFSYCCYCFLQMFKGFFFRRVDKDSTLYVLLESFYLTPGGTLRQRFDKEFIIIEKKRERKKNPNSSLF